MQFHPRSRARSTNPRVRSWATVKEAKALGFAGYKVGMTHLLINDTNKNSLTKGKDIFCPVTVVECPPLKTSSIVFYKNADKGTKIVGELFADSVDKELSAKVLDHKKKGQEVADFYFIRIKCYTQPKLTGIGKKQPDVFEVAVGGNKEQQLAYAKDKLGKEITINEVFKEGQMLDIHAITKAKGFQGARKKFGIRLRSHKSEKSIRNPGSLGAWRGQGHMMWRIAHAGKMGYHLRTEYNKWLVKIGNKPDEINVKGGYVNYGLVKNNYVLIKGSLTGVQKRLVRFTDPIRQKKVAFEPQITYTSLESKQGR